VSIPGVLGRLTFGFPPKQYWLRCIRGAPGIVGLGAFTGNPVAVKSRFNNQVEGVHGKCEFPLEDRQAASVSFHLG
jgi:hypothetical protein